MRPMNEVPASAAAPLPGCGAGAASPSCGALVVRPALTLAACPLKSGIAPLDTAVTHVQQPTRRGQRENVTWLERSVRSSCGEWRLPVSCSAPACLPLTAPAVTCSIAYKKERERFLQGPWQGFYLKTAAAGATAAGPATGEGPASVSVVAKGGLLGAARRLSLQPLVLILNPCLQGQRRAPAAAQVNPGSGRAHAPCSSALT